MDFHRLTRDLRARLGRIVGTGDGYEAFTRRRVLRQWALALAVIAAFVAIGAAGYALGTSQVVDVEAAQQAGTNAGEQRGAAVGEREGYASAFKPAREQAYNAAYNKAYEAAYRDAFAKADLAAPRSVKVSGP